MRKGGQSKKKGDGKFIIILKTWVTWKEKYFMNQLGHNEFNVSSQSGGGGGGINTSLKKRDVTGQRQR